MSAGETTELVEDNLMKDTTAHADVCLDVSTESTEAAGMRK